MPVPIKLSGDVKGASVLVLGAGLAGLTAALELSRPATRFRFWNIRIRRAAGISPSVAATRSRNWAASPSIASLTRVSMSIPARCAFLITTSRCWITASNSMCRSKPFSIINYNAMIHNSKAFGGKPRAIAKWKPIFAAMSRNCWPSATSQGKLDQAVTKEDAEVLMQALRAWGALDRNYEYKKGGQVSNHRGYDVDPGGGLTWQPTDSEPMATRRAAAIAAMDGPSDRPRI